MYKIPLYGGRIATMHLLFEGAMIVRPDRDEPVDPVSLDFVDSDSRTRIADNSSASDPLEQLIATEESIREESLDKWINDYLEHSERETAYPENYEPRFYGRTRTTVALHQSETEIRSRTHGDVRAQNAKQHSRRVRPSRESFRLYYRLTLR